MGDREVLGGVGVVGLGWSGGRLSEGFRPRGSAHE